MTATTKDTMPTRALAPWFGSGRLIAPLVGRELEGCSWVGIPFAGGMAEVAEINARSVAVNDLHRHVINLARVVADDDLRGWLIRRLKRTAFHPDELRLSQQYCRESFLAGDRLTEEDTPHVDSAVHYFVCCWMGRSHKAGGVDEFNGGISTRWNSNGGDSNVRYRSALRGLAEWGRIMRRCSFTCLDAFEFLDKCPDTAETGIYVDAPWPDDGAKYKHKFGTLEQTQLAARLSEFRNARVVVRFGDHPLIRQLYADDFTQKQFSHWNWLRMRGRTQTNETKREVLILNGPSRAEGRLFQ